MTPRSTDSTPIADWFQALLGIAIPFLSIFVRRHGQSGHVPLNALELHHASVIIRQCTGQRMDDPHVSDKLLER